MALPMLGTTTVTVLSSGLFDLVMKEELRTKHDLYFLLEESFKIHST